ncbi:MAG: TPM domain-containing protein [Rhizobiales bacterium]|nr:TPM domain-containing protein [Hyphomicrobiales bacterium]
MTLNLNLKAISQKISQAEAKTSGEIMVVLAKQSDDYQYIPILWAALLALSVPLIFIINRFFNDFLQLDLVLGNYGYLNIVYFVQLAVFVIAMLLVQYSGIKYKLVPKYIKHRRARRLAREQFMAQEIQATAERTGILLFISLAEHYVEVIADKAIYEKLDNGVWQDIVDALIVEIKQNNMNDGILSAIDAIGVLLNEEFPLNTEKLANELPNHLVLLD